MENRQRILETLDSWGVAYRLITHEAVYTIADCLRLEGIDWSVTEVPKNVFLCNRQQTSYYLALLRHDLPFRTAVVSRALGVSRLSFAPEDRLPALLGLQAGAVSPLGLLFDEQKQVTLAMDEGLRAFPYWGMHPCDSTATVVLRRQDLLEGYLRRLGRIPIWIQAEGEMRA